MGRPPACPSAASARVGSRPERHPSITRDGRQNVCRGSRRHDARHRRRGLVSARMPGPGRADRRHDQPCAEPRRDAPQHGAAHVCRASVGRCRRLRRGHAGQERVLLVDAIHRAGPMGENAHHSLRCAPTSGTTGASASLAATPRPCTMREANQGAPTAWPLRLGGRADERGMMVMGGSGGEIRPAPPERDSG